MEACNEMYKVWSCALMYKKDIAPYAFVMSYSLKLDLKQLHANVGLIQTDLK